MPLPVSLHAVVEEWEMLGGECGPQSLAQLHGCGAAKVEGVAVASGTESNTSMQAWIAFDLLPITPRFRTRT